MFGNILHALFGCPHSNYSFPITTKRGRNSTAGAVTGTYVVCLECGKEFPYDWKQMKIVSINEGKRQPVNESVQPLAKHTA